MASGFIIRKNQYYDSVFLMGVNKRLSQTKGVLQTAVLMASENNKRLLADIGIHGDQIVNAKPNDLIVAVIAETPQVVDAVLAGLDQALHALEEKAPVSHLHTLDDGLAVKPHANLVVLSIPGEYVIRETRKALDAGLNLFVFSSNVPIEEERKLKEQAAEKKLLIMGPDCGTSILGGVGVGFSNVVNRGAFGAIGPSGTGLQEFTCQIHSAGWGISHAIGTGSHDLSDEIGGITTFQALEVLEADPQTKVITIISKPPGEKTLKRLVARLKLCSKPVVCCFLGARIDPFVGEDALTWAPTIDDAVLAAIQHFEERPTTARIELTQQERELATKARAEWAPEQRFLRGLFAGGTFCYQSQQILGEAGIVVHSNAPLNPDNTLADPDKSSEHTLIDMGDEAYTLGRPHPMIDGTMRRQRILSESRDPSVAILLLDFILGYNASMDPVGELYDAILETKQRARQQGGELTVLASICGTEEDPQELDLQEKLLREAGAIVFPSNAKAVLFCCELLKPG
jgi:succinyl-CoA synthetase alpha subunit